jgi:hypothetical protein
MNKKFILLLLTFLLSAGIIFAQEEQSGSVSAEEVISEEAVQDENITSADLDILEPTLLPDSPFYFLRDGNEA